jgi:predicted AAA+ superfamily ATPase
MTDNKSIDRLRRLSESRIKNTSVKFHRLLLDEIDWDHRLIGISGARGTGKTTLILQYLKICRHDLKQIYDNFPQFKIVFTSS